MGLPKYRVLKGVFVNLFLRFVKLNTGKSEFKKLFLKLWKVTRADWR